MSYDIYIGNIEMRKAYQDEEYTEITEHSRIIDGKTVYFEPYVPEVRLENAPTFPNDEMTGNSNNRHPGYSQWAEFCRKAGLYNLFFNEDGLMNEHPGHAALTQKHADVIQLALMRWEKIFPNSVPGFGGYCPTEGDDEVAYDGILARLLWLNFWVQWAVKNCENPAIYNF